MEVIVYRKSSKGDLPQILDLLKAFDLNATKMEAGGFLVAARKRRVLGCARIMELNDGNIELSSMAVVQECRRKGIGGKIIKTLLGQEYRRPVYLMCKRENQKFYEGQGFAEIRDELLPAAYKSKVDLTISKTRIINGDGLAMVKNK